MTMALFVTFFVCLLIGIPITFSLGIASLAAVLIGDLPMVVIAQRVMPAIVDASVLVCIPLFILAGNVLSYGGMGDRLVNVANMLVGRSRGGLGSANVLASMLFGGISGSAAADTSAVGSVMIPSMERQGYDRSIATAITVISSPLGAIIPPSIIMIVFCWVTETSIASIFAAGYLPGLLLGGVLILVSWVMSVRRGYPVAPAISWGERARIVFDALPALAMPFMIIGGIVGGVATATETAALASVYGFLVSMFYYRDLRWSAVPELLLDTIKLTGVVLLIIAMAAVYGWLMAYDRVPFQVAEALGAMGLSPFAFLAVYVALMIFLGCFLAPTEALIIAVPILFPVAMQLGIDPLHFGVVSVTALAFGHVSPPVGVCLFVGSAISGLSLGHIIRSLMPFYVAVFAALMLIAFYAPITLIVPQLLGMSR